METWSYAFFLKERDASLNTREKMIQCRKDRHVSIPDMAQRCRISSYLLQLLEDGAVTTPKLVPQIAEAYNLSELEAEELMPEHMRPHGDDYDPDRYVVNMPVSCRVMERLPDFLWSSRMKGGSWHRPHSWCNDEEASVPNKRRDA